MSHWIIVPVVLPAVSATLLLLFARGSTRAQRLVGGVATFGLLGVAVLLTARVADGSVVVYRLGDWPPPFGIVLVLDRLSALMVLLTATLATLSYLYAINGADLRGANYHALFQFQLMGLCGAFLTGDLFNLFVFFEVLLIASYGLLLYAGGRARIRAGIHYIVFNLIGSSLFLVGVGTLYAITGTLNMADLAVKVAATDPANAALVQSAALILLVVFGIKAALLPLYVWLPRAYSSATAPVAALFAIMTKVGVYAILRVYTLVFGPHAGVAANVAWPWVLPLGLATLVAGTLGALASRWLGGMVAYLVIASVGTMLTGVALATPESTAAAIYYMIHSTLVLAGLFLLVDVIARQRGETEGRLRPGPALAQPATLGGLFLLGGVAVAGLPPLSGFVGKVLLLRSALETPSAAWVYVVVLGTGLLTLVTLGRSGSTVFWNVRQEPADDGLAARPARASRGELLPVAILLALVVLLAVLAGPIVDYATATADQLSRPAAYVQDVLGGAGAAEGAAAPAVRAPGGGS